MGKNKLFRDVVLPPMGYRRRLLELGKDLLIVLLLLSACYLAARSQLYTGLMDGEGLLSRAVTPFTGTDQTDPVETDPTVPAEGIQAVRLAVCHGLGESGQPIRYGVQYDAAQAGTDFSALSNYLFEAAASASDPQVVSQLEWLQALQSPGVYFDLLGNVPLDYLGSSSRTDPVRRLALVWEGGPTARLYYKNETSGLYYSCGTSVQWDGYLEHALEDYTDNGARFAFELEGSGCESLQSETLIFPQAPQPGLYQVQTVLDLNDAASRTALENALGFRGADYPVPGEWVIREEDELRISADGTLVYEAASESLEPRYQAGSRTQAVALAFHLTQAAVEAWCGGVQSSGQLCLSEVQEDGETLSITLNYTLDGAEVYLSGGRPAASFTVSGGQITAFEIHPRCYVPAEGSSSVLPERQAAAALAAVSPEARRELLLFYEEEDGSPMAARWGGF